MLETFCLDCAKAILGGSKFPSSGIPSGYFSLCVGMTSASSWQDIKIQSSSKGVMTGESEQGLGTWEEDKTAWVGRVGQRSGGAEIRCDRKEDRSN